MLKIDLGPVVRKVDSAIGRIVIFLTGAERHKLKAMKPRILNSQEVKSIFNSKIVNFITSFTSYGAF